MLATLFQLEDSQWWSAERLQSYQLRQLDKLLHHAREHVPHYRHWLAPCDWIGRQPLTPELWSQLPTLKRAVIEDQPQDLVAQPAPQHGRTNVKRTSGSSGDPLQVLGTEITDLFWRCVTMRDHLWRRRDFSGRLLAIRSGRYATQPMAVYDGDSWGPPASSVYKTGPMTLFYHRQPIPQQAELLRKRNPHYVLTYPSNAIELAGYFQEQGWSLPNLREVRTYGEPVSQDVRAVCGEVWGVGVSDVYSCEEVGYLALPCPDYPHYHVQSETVFVEILDAEDEPCLPGQSGRVVATPLHNFAMPLIRYELGDYVQAGSPCQCGRELPVLEQVLGRKRNLCVSPDGRLFQPLVSRTCWRSIDGIRRVQLVQYAVDQIEVRLEASGSLGDFQRNQITRQLAEALGFPFQFSIRQLAEIPRHPNGKFETFISKEALAKLNLQE